METSTKDISDTDPGRCATMGELGLQFVEQFEMTRVLEKFYEELRAVVATAAMDSDVGCDTEVEGVNP